MRYRLLGRTGLRISAVGLGGRMLGHAVDEAGTRALVDAAGELGIDFIDTAESYGHGRSEAFLGAALEGRRNDFVIATKTGRLREPGYEDGARLNRRRIVERLEGSLRRLRTEYVDLYYFHYPDPLTPLDESLRAIDDLVTAGKIRYHGLSNYPAWQVAEAVGLEDRHGWTRSAACQSGYHLLDRLVEAELVPACAHLGLSLIPYSPLAGGLLSGKFARATPPAGTYDRSLRFGAPAPGDDAFDAIDRYRAMAADRGRSLGELAIAWLLAQPVVGSVIAGTTSVEQLRENARASEWELDREALDRLAGP